MMEFVYDVKNWKKWWSMRFLIISAFLQAVTLAYATLPYDWMPAIPDWVKLTLATLALGSAGLAGVSRVVKQSGLHDDTKTVVETMKHGVSTDER